jgi:ABC-2 type transport system ATP-binding protein
MENFIITTNRLNYAFSKGGLALDNIEMRVPGQSIYGFLGPNGAGKTTTLRLLTGLLRSQQGEIRIFGSDIKRDRIGILKRLGASIEQPSLYQHLTGRENLEIYRVIYQCNRQRIDDVLEMAGLILAGNKKVKQYSLGMKQRLAIAIAMLHKPELLILDEPTNGLDPSGIIETREYLKLLNSEFGTTVLVSSHILAEIEKMATHVGIIHKGRMLYQGGLKELQQMQSAQSELEIQTSNNELAISLLKDEFAVGTTASGFSISCRDKQIAAMVNRRLVEHGLDIYALHPRHAGLEELFIDIIAETK